MTAPTSVGSDRPSGNPDPAMEGLTQAEAAGRLAADGANLLPGTAPKSPLSIVLQVLPNPCS